MLPDKDDNFFDFKFCIERGENVKDKTLNIEARNKRIEQLGNCIQFVVRLNALIKTVSLRNSPYYHASDFVKKLMNCFSKNVKDRFEIYMPEAIQCLKNLTNTIFFEPLTFILRTKQFSKNNKHMYKVYEDICDLFNTWVLKDK